MNEELSTIEKVLMALAFPIALGFNALMLISMYNAYTTSTNINTPLTQTAQYVAQHVQNITQLGTTIAATILIISLTYEIKQTKTYQNWNTK